MFEYICKKFIQIFCSIAFIFSGIVNMQIDDMFVLGLIAMILGILYLFLLFVEIFQDCKEIKKIQNNVTVV
jgi:hypothetical protein